MDLTLTMSLSRYAHNFSSLDLRQPNQRTNKSINHFANMVSMDQIGYDVVSRVLESWDAARRTGKESSFEKAFGKLLIDK